MLQIPEKYFHDRLILLILSVNTFVVLLNTVLVLLRLDSTSTSSYIVECRNCSAQLPDFAVGSPATFWTFVLFSALVLVGNILISMRIYTMHRRYAVTILALSTLLIVLTLIVTNALLVLR